MTDWGSIPDEHQRIAKNMASEFGVDGTIHDRDFIYWHERKISPEHDQAHAARSYIQGGRASAHIIRDWLQAHRPSREDFSILDFASGYGRVTRFLNEAMPAARVCASDIHPDAVDFIRSLGSDAFVSSSVPENFQGPRKFDVIFSISFFTHMPRSSWGRWLTALVSSLDINGLLIFTTHGQAIWPLMGRPTLEPDGFFFRAESEQHDLDVEEYGNTVTSAGFVIGQLAGLPVHVEGLRSPGLGLHDVWFVRRVEADRLLVLASPEPAVEERLKLGFREAAAAWWRGVAGA